MISNQYLLNTIVVKYLLNMCFTTRLMFKKFQTKISGDSKVMFQKVIFC